jgi:RHS repeat-associated protein
LGNNINFGYDALGRLTAMTDRMSRTTTYAYDAPGRLASVTKPIIGTATYTRNDQGLLTRITDLRGKNWDFGYSTMGRLTSQTDPLGRQRTYAYDARGRLQQITYPSGSGTATYTYDAASNVTQIAYSGGPTLNFTYDDAGRLLTANDITLTYDARGDITNSQDGSASFGATYDNGRRLKTVTYDGQATVTYTYDARNLLTRVEDNRASAWMNFAYDNDGQLTGITRSNSVGTTYTYDNAGRVTRIQDGALADQQYTLNAEGEPTQVVRTLPLDPAPVGQVANLSYDDAAQISSAGYTYDARGRQTAAPGKTFGYDGASRLTSVTASGSTASFTYNGLDDLCTRTVGGSTTTFYHNYAVGLNPIVAEKEGASYKRIYVYTPGGALLYSIDPATNQVRFYHFDRLGSTLFLSDGAGAVSDAYAYDPYGNVLGRTGTSDQPFTYVGQYGVRSEPVGNLYDMRARTYDPLTAHFLTRDPVWPLLSDPEGLNPYQYAYQNPLSYVDPEGTGVLSWLRRWLLGEAVETVTSVEVPLGPVGAFAWTLSGGELGVGSDKPPPPDYVSFEESQRRWLLDRRARLEQEREREEQLRAWQVARNESFERLRERESRQPPPPQPQGHAAVTPGGQNPGVDWGARASAMLEWWAEQEEQAAELEFAAQWSWLTGYGDYWYSFTTTPISRREAPWKQ